MRDGIVVRAARWSALHRWTAVLVWVGFVALSVVLGGMVGTKQLSDGEGVVGESGRAYQAQISADFKDKPTEMVLIQPRDGGRLSDADAATVVAQLRSAYAAAGGVAAVDGPLTSPDGRSRAVQVQLETGNLTGGARTERAESLVDPLLQATARVASQHPGLRIEQVGDASLDKAISQIVADDLRKAEITSLPITLVILVVVFGALLAAGVPVLLAITAVAAALGLTSLASQLYPMDESVASVVLLIGMAVGVDYSLFYIRREREERRRGASRLESIEIAARTSGRAVVVSGITVLISMGGLLISGMAVFESMAIATMLVVAVSMLGSVTVLPALLSLLGNRIDRPRVPLVHRLRRGDGSSRSWHALLRVVLARPALSLSLGALSLLALALPALNMTLRSESAAALPRSIEIIQSYDRLSAAFPSEGDAQRLVISSTTSAPLPQQQVSAAVADLARSAGSSGLFALQTPPQPVFSTDGKVAVVDLPIPYDSNDSRAIRSIDLLRHDLVPATLGTVPGTWTGVTGSAAFTHDFADELTQRLPWVFLFVLGLTFLVMLAAFQSLVVAVTSIVLNMFSVGAAYGLLVLVFQNTWAEGLLGFRSVGGIITWMPLFLFVILFGLSMDYHVFLVSRIRESMRQGLTARDAVREGVLRSASTITSAATVMIAVFSIFATLSLLTFKQLGVGLAAAVLIDATVVRIVLLPATMALLGRHNWYLPRWLGWIPSLEHGSPRAPRHVQPLPAAPETVARVE